MKTGVPSPDAPLGDLLRFALTYNGHERLGGFEAAAEVANKPREHYDVDGTLPATLNEARLSLFFEQRRWRHFGYDPVGKDERYVRALVERIFAFSEGQVHADGYVP